MKVLKQNGTFRCYYPYTLNFSAMNTALLSSPIMFVTTYWGSPAFVKVTPTGDLYDLQINDQHMALLSYNDRVLTDVEERLSDSEMLKEISRRIQERAATAA